MLSFIAVAFLLAVTFFLGWYVAQQVPDEVVHSRRWLRLAADALLLAIVGIVAFAYGKPFFALAAVLVTLGLRWLSPQLNAPAAGVALGAATLLSVDVQASAAVLCLVMNFLWGASSEERPLPSSLMQPIAAVAVALVLLFVAA